MKTKKYLTILAAALTLAACTSDELVEPTVDDAEEQTAENGDSLSVSISLDANLENEPEEDLDNPGGTRATFNTTTYAVQWEKGDKVVFTNGSVTTEQVVTEVKDDGSAKFGNVSTENTVFGSLTGSFYGFYPDYYADVVTGEQWSYSGTTITGRVYTEQDYTENTDGTFGGYMIGTNSEIDGNSVNLTFKLIGSIIDVTLPTDVTAESVSLCDVNAIPLAGKFSVDCANPGTMTIYNDATDYSYGTSSDVVTVSNIPDAATSVRFYVLPTSHSGLTVTVRDTDGNYYTKKSSNPIGTGTAETVTALGTASTATCVKPYYKKLNFGTATTATRTENWMACVPGNIFFNMLSLLGAHDAASKDAEWANISKAQNLSITDLLEGGVRAFDLRPYVTSGNSSAGSNVVNIYHGTSNCNIKFYAALQEINTFLSNNPTETVLITLHDEAAGGYWATPVLADLETVEERIYYPYTNPTRLSSCRGKMIICTRDDLNNTAYAFKVGWGSAYSGSSTLDGISANTMYVSGSSIGNYLYYQDDYAWNSDYKTDRITDIEGFQTSVVDNYNGGRKYYIFINMCNVAGAVLNSNSYITTTSAYVNNQVYNSTVFNDNTKGPFGSIFIDYALDSDHSGDKLYKLIRDHNFHYVYQKRTRVLPGTSLEDAGTTNDDEKADGSIVYTKKQRF